MSFSPVPYNLFGNAAVDAINAAVTAVDNEVAATNAAAQAAETTLSGDIQAETTARQQSDQAEATARQQGDQTEATARQGADTALGARIDGVNTNVQAAQGTLTSYIQGETARAEQAEAITVTYVQGETERAEAAEDTITGYVQAETRRATAAEAAAQTAASTAVATATDANANAATARAATDALPAQLAAAAVALFLSARPGEVPAAFTTDLASGIAGVPLNAAQATTPLGAVLRVTGALPALATTAVRAIEPNRTYRVRAVFQRVTDTAAPTPAAVVFAVAWYGADRNLLTVPSTPIAVVALAVASGVARYSALLSLNPPDQSDLGNPRVAQPPAGAVYLRPFVQIFGSDVVTDLAVIEHADVTDATTALPGPSDMVLARLARVEAALNLPAL